MILFTIIWNVAVTVLMLWDPHPKLDLHHCAVDHVNLVRVCFPKDACYQDWLGNAMCWRNIKVGGH